MNCRMCNIELNEGNWPIFLQKRSNHICKNCSNERQKKYIKTWYKKNRDKIREKTKQRRIENPEKYKEYQRKYIEKHIDQRRQYEKEYYTTNRLKIKGECRERLIKLKMSVLKHYSPALTCQRCGFSDVRALSIDHIHGGGRIHKHEIGGGPVYYRWFIKNNFPEGFQVLCMNCNFIKQHENKEFRKPNKEVI